MYTFTMRTYYSLMRHMQLEIIRYDNRHKEEWDSFTRSSKNGTFLFERGYMDYHKERFTDYSLMIFHNGVLHALLPATLNKGKEQIASHGGLTYGGLITNVTATAEEILEIFSAIIEYYKKETGASCIIYKPTPHIYHTYPGEEDLYALFRNNATLIERKISSTIKLKDALPIKGRRKLTSAMKSRLQIIEDCDFASFWRILEERLTGKYGVMPVHTLEEIELLHSRFPNNIRLFRVVNKEERTLGGAVIFVTDNVAHMQYAGTTEEGRRIGVMDYLYEYLITERFADKEYFDFGISVEDGGQYLNSGLIAHKERLGGRAIMYDTYYIDIKNRN